MSDSPSLGGSDEEDELAVGAVFFAESTDDETVVELRDCAALSMLSDEREARGASQRSVEGFLALSAALLGGVGAAAFVTGVVALALSLGAALALGGVLLSFAGVADVDELAERGGVDGCGGGEGDRYALRGARTEKGESSGSVALASAAMSLSLAWRMSHARIE